MIDKKVILNDIDFTIKDLIESPDAYFVEIKTFDILERSEDDNVLELICSKIRKGGSLIIEGFEILHICRSVFYGSMDIKDFSNMVKNINRVSSLVSLKNHFTNKGWEIAKSGLEHNRYFLKVVRK